MNGAGPVSSTRVEFHRELRRLWCHRSRQTGWNPPDEWWTPAVDAMCAAAVAGDDMSAGCARFGQTRARSGVTIGAALDDFAALSDVLGWPSPPLHLVKALTEGWVDAERSPEDCQDPLTGLATVAYLRTRLEELYRGATREPPSACHRLIIVSLDPAGDPWRHTTRLIVLGHELRSFFTRGESLALLNRSRAGVLIAEEPDTAERIDHLRDDVHREHGADVWWVPLPDTYERLPVFLRDMAKPP